MVEISEIQKDIIFNNFYQYNTDYNLDIFMNSKGQIIIKNNSNEKELIIRPKLLINYDLKNEKDYKKFLNDINNKLNK